jgi:hypothetical protein
MIRTCNVVYWLLGSDVSVRDTPRIIKTIFSLLLLLLKVLNIAQFSPCTINSRM